jgi:2'-5' RNA ligase
VIKKIELDKSNKQTIQINIAIIPEEQILEEAITLSELLHKNFDIEFALNKQNFLPHITISQARYPKRNLTKVIDTVTNHLSSIQPFNIILNLFEIYFNHYIFWNAERIPSLISLHQQIVNTTNPLREGLVLEHIAAMDNLSEEDASDRKKYGALLIGSRYQPHITLAYLKQVTLIDEITKVIRKSKKEHFRASKIVVSYLGNYGTVKEIIKEIALLKSI